MNHNNRIARELNLQPRQVHSAIELFQDGNTIPFIARYRKEMTFSLDELQLRQIEQKYKYYEAVDTRREQIISAIGKQDKLTDEIHEKLINSFSLVGLEDLYQPYKTKRRTRASKAIDAGLKPLADKILIGNRGDLVSEARRFICEDYSIVEDVLAGARDIVAQTIADNIYVRQEIRSKMLEWGRLESKRIKDADDEKAVFRLYYDFSNRAKWIKPYQILAMNRGEAEKVLRIKIQIEERDWLPVIRRHYVRKHQQNWLEQLELSIVDAGKRLILPAVERYLRRYLTEIAHEHAIEVFADNLRGLLLQAPLPNTIVMGIDPGFRTGCKVAVIDETGKVLDTCTIYPNPPQNDTNRSLGKLKTLVEQYNVDLVAIGNGTASRETELLIADLVKQCNGLKYLIVSEAGASVYSASEVARSELPDMDVTLRGAVSIARRVQDPLAELVKIDPKSIGVGLYQHDLNQNELSDALTWIVQTVVNRVGVELNTSSVSLLRYVAGISENIAKNIVAYREDAGRFRNRMELQAVGGIGEKTFQQCAGFLRIRDSQNWMDGSAIHPESYSLAREITRTIGIHEDISPEMRQTMIDNFFTKTTTITLAKRLNVGEPTIVDILEQVVQPGRDPREDVAPPILRSDVLKMEDLQEGMIVDGVVRNVVDFGAFIDIGVKQDGLLHSSKITRDMVIAVGDNLKLNILSIDIERGRIGLSLS